MSSESLVEGSGVAPTIGPERIEEYLRSSGRPARVASLRRIGGGTSRETWLAELDAATPELPRVIALLKQPVGGGVVPTSLEREYQVLRAVAGTGVPVPAPILYEPDEGWLGGPFYIREGFEGTSDQRQFEGRAAARLVEQLGGALARLHSQDPDALPLPDMERPATLGAAAEQEVERWGTYWREHAVEPMPVADEIGWWLRHNRPEAPGAPVLLWGDPGVANTVCAADGTVLALSDWELSHVGDPMQDIAWALWRGLGRLEGRGAFLDAYVAAGGAEIDERRIEYYDVLTNWQVAIFAHTSIRETVPGSGRRLHVPLLAIWAQRINLHKACRGIGI